MFFTSTIRKLRLVFSCCNKRKSRQSVEIGGPTDVRRVDISESLPGLTDVQRKQIRKKASSDAACLKSLRSHPPIIAISPVVPNTPTPAPTTSPNPHRVGSQPINTFSEQLSSVICFYEPTISTSLSNAASKDEPSNLPTPPRLLHKEDDLPAMRMKSMWKSDKRYNSDSGGHDDILYETLPGVKEVKERGSDELKALNFEFDLESKESGSDASRKLGSIRASEMQDTAEYEQGLNDTTPKQHT